jgi:hypothetical protein
MASRSRRMISRESCLIVRASKSRGRRESRAHDAPAASRAMIESTPQVHRVDPAFPAQWFTAYFVLSPEIGFIVSVAGKFASADLTPASRRQDHTTLPSAAKALVRSNACVHRIPPPTSVTIAKRPSSGGGTVDTYS